MDMHLEYVKAVEQTHRRISACTNTIATVREELFDPIFLEERANLLIAAEDLFNEALTLVQACREIAWPDNLAEPIRNERN
jgi:hypothetical protein